jgi:hypothetical protein
MSVITTALTLYQDHIQSWLPHLTSHHPHWTRGEKKRIQDATWERDKEFVMYYMDSANNLDRINAAIIVMVYLSKEHILFQYEKFRTTVWNKISEFESVAHTTLERIERIIDHKAYDAERELRDRMRQILFIVKQVRAVLRTF